MDMGISNKVDPLTDRRVKERERRERERLKREGVSESCVYDDGIVRLNVRRIEMGKKQQRQTVVELWM